MALPAPGTPFPPIALRDERGNAAPRLGGDALYAFFKTTCPTSALALPYVDRLRRLAAGGGLAVVGVSQDDPETTARFYEELNVGLPTLYDPEPWSASEALGLETVPTLLLVAPEGIVADSAVGFQRKKLEEYAGLAARLSGRPLAELFLPGDNVPAIRPG